MSTNAMLLSFLFALLTLSVALYASLELRMLLGYWRMKADSQGSADSDTDTSGHQPALPRSEPPTVSVLLPIYNEGATVLPLLQAVAEFDYPHERMDIQVLDDSTDETPAIVATEIERLRREGIPISHVRRNSRKGWKAGALDHALEDSSAEFVAIFDADFVPPPQFLRRALLESDSFNDPQVAFVQGRWTYINEDQNLLTRTQAILLDRHFVVQKPYLTANHGTTVFNGSGGVWRRAAIDAAGGWSSDTLCEDLDLSYRCALNGWIGVYDAMLDVPNEIPSNIFAFKLQQRRWAKGSAQCMRKLALNVIKSKTLQHRSDDLYVLMGYTIHPFVLLYALLLPFVITSGVPLSMIWAGNTIQFIANAIAIAGFITTAVNSHRNLSLKSVGNVLLATYLGISLMVNNTIAFVGGCYEKFSVFERTPKAKNLAGSQSLLGSVVHWGIFMEVAFTVYMFVAAGILIGAGHGFLAMPCVLLGAGMLLALVYQLLLALPQLVSVRASEA